jgi:hypothetical protein
MVVFLPHPKGKSLGCGIISPVWNTAGLSLFSQIKRILIHAH